MASLIHSVFLFFGMFSLSGAVLLILQYRKASAPFISSWIIGSILIGISTLIIAMLEVKSASFPYKIANCLNISAYIYFVYSLRFLLGGKAHFSKVAFISLVAAFIFIASLTLVADQIGAEYQPAVIAFYGFLFNLYIGLLSFKFFRQQKIGAAFALGLTSFLTALTWCARLYWIFHADTGFVFEGGTENLVAFNFLLFLGISRYMSFFALAASIERYKGEKVISENHLIKVELAHTKVEKTEKQLLESLNMLAMARDNETGQHIIRTQNYVKRLALRLREMGHYINELSDEAIDLLFKAAPLHDIGKVGIPDSILLKQGPLNDDEWQIMKTHTSIGENVLSSAEHDSHGEGGVIKNAFKIAGGHHEKWDGSGYPRGLAGEDIPLPARIMALADVYDALVNKRVYKHGWSHEDAVQEIVSKRGLQFDPLVVDAFILEADSFLAISRQYEDN